MTGAPGLADAGKAMSKARAHLDVAAQGDDPAVKRDRYRQAAKLLGYTSRVLDTLATPPPAAGGVPLNFGAAQAPSRAPVFGP